MRAAQITVLVFAVTAGPLIAKTLPPDLCSLLAPAEIEKTLGQPFAAPEKSTAPSPFAGNPAGTQCEFQAQKGASIKLVFIAYVDPSVAKAKQTFDKLAMWYTPKSKPAIGDSAYFDKNEGIHVLKGKVRYFLTIEGADTAKSAPYTSWSQSKAVEPPVEKQLKDLAALVAGKI